MPEYVEDETETTDESPEEPQQPTQHPRQPIEIQPDGTWILGRGADRWIPSKNQLGDMRWLVEEKRPVELNLPPLEDANAVMLWLMDVLRGLAEGRTTEKTAGIMLYGLQLAMVNARFTTFHETDHKEMVRKAPGDRRNRRNRASSPGSEARATPIFTAKDAEVAATPRSGEKALPQRNTEGDQNHADPQDSSSELSAGTGQDFTAKGAVVAKEEKPEAGTALRVENSLEPPNAEVNPGVESAKSIFFGVEPGEGVADNRPASPPPEPARKSSQSEVLMIPKDVEHHLRR